MRGTWPSILLSAISLAAIACDAKPDGKREDLEAAAAATLPQEDEATKKLREKEAAERKAAFEAKKKAEAEQKAKLDAITTTVIGQPAKLPKSLDAACTELIEIYEEWIRAIYFDDDGAQLEFFDAKSKNLGEVKGKCAKIGSIESAACMTHVIKAVSAEGFSEADRKLLQAKPDYLFEQCVAKYAPDKFYNPEPAPAEAAAEAPAE